MLSSASVTSVSIGDCSAGLGEEKQLSKGWSISKTAGGRCSGMLLRAHFVQGTEWQLWLLPEPDVCGGEFISLEIQCGILDSPAGMGTWATNGEATKKVVN